MLGARAPANLDDNDVIFALSDGSCPPPQGASCAPLPPLLLVIHVADKGSSNGRAELGHLRQGVPRAAKPVGEQLVLRVMREARLVR